MRNFKKIVITTALTLTTLAANADTQTVGANVNFVEDVSATVDNAIEFGTLVKADGTCSMAAADASLSGSACSFGAVTGTPAVGTVTVSGVADASIQIDIDASGANDTGITFTPNMVNSTDTASPLGISNVNQTLTAGSQTYLLYGDLDITAATVSDTPNLSVDFTVVYN